MCVCNGGYTCIKCMPDENKPVPHKHAALIKAWADGAKIEWQRGSVWSGTEDPRWNMYTNYRIKPEVKPDVSFDIKLYKEGVYSPKIYASMETSAYVSTAQSRTWEHNARIVFDGETGLLKSVEMI